MCLAVPGRIREIYERDGLRMGRVDFDGIAKEVCLEYLPEAEEGDYAVVHVGFAIARIDEEAARETLEALRAIGEAGAEEEGEGGGEEGGAGGNGGLRCGI